MPQSPTSPLSEEEGNYITPITFAFVGVDSHRAVIQAGEYPFSHFVIFVIIFVLICCCFEMLVSTSRQIADKTDARNRHNRSDGRRHNIFRHRRWLVVNEMRLSCAD